VFLTVTVKELDFSVAAVIWRLAPEEAKALNQALALRFVLAPAERDELLTSLDETTPALADDTMTNWGLVEFPVLTARVLRSKIMAAVESLETWALVSREAVTSLDLTVAV